MPPTLRATTTLAPVGAVDTHNTPPSITAPTCVAGDLLMVAVFHAQGVGSTGIGTPANMTMISIVGTSTNRLGAIYAAVVTDPSMFASGIILSSGSTSTRVAAVAWSLAPGASETFTLAGLTTSGPDWNGSSMTTDTFPGAVTGDMILGVSMTNKSASTTYTVHSAVGGGTAIAQARALAGATGSQSDSVLSAWIGGTGVSFNIAQANGQAYSVGITMNTPANPLGRPVKMGNGVAAKATYLDGSSARVAPTSMRVFYPGWQSLSVMETVPGATWAHRGGSTAYPEMSEYAFDRSCMWGYGAIEFSARRTSDGVWFGIHDDTLARTSQNVGLTASVTTMTWAEVQAQLNSLNSDAVSRPYYKLDDFLAKYTDHILIVDNKPGSQHVSEFLPKVLAVPNALDRVIMKHDGVQSTIRFQESKAAGFKVAGYWYAVNYAANLPARAPYTDYIGMEYNATQTVWDEVLAYGKKTWGHVCPNQSAYNAAIARGANFVQCAGVDIIKPIR